MWTFWHVQITGCWQSITNCSFGFRLHSWTPTSSYICNIYINAEQIIGCSLFMFVDNTVSTICIQYFIDKRETKIVIGDLEWIIFDILNYSSGDFFLSFDTLHTNINPIKPRLPHRSLICNQQLLCVCILYFLRIRRN